VIVHFGAQVPLSPDRAQALRWSCSWRATPTGASPGSRTASEPGPPY